MGTRIIYIHAPIFLFLYVASLYKTNIIIYKDCYAFLLTLLI